MNTRHLASVSNLNQRLRAQSHAFRALLLVASMFGALACDEKEPRQLPTSPVVAPFLDAGSLTDAKRIVTQRNPFGATEVRGNLMADGDFEFTGRQQQMPWLAFANRGQATLNFETGGHCRSGIRCAVVKQDESVIGWLASPAAGVLSVTVAIQPSTGVCKDVAVRVLDVESDVRATLVQPPSQPDADGYCTFRGTSPAIADGRPALYVEVTKNRDLKISNSAILDNAIVTAAQAQIRDESGGALQQPAAPAHWDALDASTLARVQFIRSWLRSHRSYGIPKTPPPENPTSQHTH